MSDLTIVMYHYVRDLERSRYPALKARRTAEFMAQLDCLAQNYQVVTAQQVVAACRGDSPLPPRAAWLTFDDGYLDHYTTVFPLLCERGWQGTFFAPTQTVADGRLLDVNKIHLILASVANPGSLLERIRTFVGRLPDLSYTSLWTQHAQADRFDPAEIIFIKRILQHALPLEARTELVDALFAEFVSCDPAAIAAETYMSLTQLKHMVREGMFAGSHGSNHFWMDRLEPAQQELEIDGSLEFLRGLGVSDADWIMCYPYGAYNQTLLQILRRKGCAVGLTTRSAVARIGVDNPLELPRLDTNDLPP